MGWELNDFSLVSDSGKDINIIVKFKNYIRPKFIFLAE